MTFIQDLLTLVDFNNDEDQVSNSEEFKWNDDGGGGSTDAKHIKKTRSSELLPLKMMKMKWKLQVWQQSFLSNIFNWTTRWTWITTVLLIIFIEQWGVFFNYCHWAVNKKTQTKKIQKKTIRLKAKIWQCWCSILVSWYFHNFSTS